MPAFPSATPAIPAASTRNRPHTLRFSANDTVSEAPPAQPFVSAQQSVPVEGLFSVSRKAAQRSLKKVLQKVMQRLFPNQMVRPTLKMKDMSGIDSHWLKEKGLKGLIFDLDETLMTRRSGKLEPRIQKALTHLQEEGIGCFVLSNNRSKTYTDRAAKLLGLPVICKAKKPNPEGFQTAMSALGFSATEIAVVGDRPLTDILGGQRLGTVTILVEPLSGKKELRVLRWLRKLEHVFVLE